MSFPACQYSGRSACVNAKRITRHGSCLEQSQTSAYVAVSLEGSNLYLFYNKTNCKHCTFSRSQSFSKFMPQIFLLRNFFVKKSEFLIISGFQTLGHWLAENLQM